MVIYLSHLLVEFIPLDLLTLFDKFLERVSKRDIETE